MSDEPDPPRKFFQLKPTEFQVVNERVPPRPGTGEAAAPDTGPNAADTGRINVKDHFMQAAAPKPVRPAKIRREPENDVQALLREQFARDQAAGRYNLGALDDSKRRRRIRNYWIALVVINVPLGLFAYRIGHQLAIPFVCAIAGMALATSWLTWQTFFLRTEY